MKITCTNEDIALGIRHDPRACPIALAIRRTLGRKVSVTQDSIMTLTSTGKPDRRFASLKTPSACFFFLRQFDRGQRVEPFSFNLPVLEDINA